MSSLEFTTRSFVARAVRQLLIQVEHVAVAIGAEHDAAPVRRPDRVDVVAGIEPSARTQLTWFDRTGKALGPIGPPGLYRNPALSPDGTRLAVEATDSQRGKQDISLVELARGVTSRSSSTGRRD